MQPTVLITGAAGNLAAKLRRHFATLGWTLRLTDIVVGGDPAIVAADLSVWDDAWVSLFADVDAVIHLAGHASPHTGWADVVQYNFDLTQNVYEAAVRQRARRLIFASSNWVMAGHRFAHDLPLRPDMAPHPINPYGVSKLVGERLGRSYHARWGLSVICLRIGYCQPGDNQPGPHMGWNSWGQLMWLSDRDFCQALERSVVAEGIGFAVLNLMSDNPGMRWDISETRRLLGYAPQDGAAPQLTAAMQADEAAARTVRSAALALDDLAATRCW